VIGNITGGNIRTAGIITATGNVTGNYFIGNGSQLTGIDTTQIQNGNSSVTITSAGSNVVVNVRGVSPLAIFANTGLYVTGVVESTANVTVGNLLTGGLITASGNIAGGNVSTAGFITATGNVTGGNVITGGLITATGNITGGNISTAGVLTATGNITGGNIITAGIITVNSGDAGTAIVNGGSNSVGNIGSSSKYFNTVFALATSAQYADLAECYSADTDYEPGTVIMFGGSAEVTRCDSDMCVTVAGVISTNPAYKMNSGMQADHVAEVALTGRVPCKVIGQVNKGAMMVSAGNGHARAEANPVIGSVIGKAIESFNGESGTIEIAVGRL
jgi:hypothetical protein